MNLRAGALWLALASPWASSAQARADGAAAKIFVVEVSADAVELDATKLRTDIGKELGATVVAPADLLGSQARGTIVVSIDHAARALVVSYCEDGAPITRSIDLPADPAETERATVHLAGNLARDEAGELVDSLRRSKAPADGTVHTATPTPPRVDDESVRLDQLGTVLLARANEGHGPARALEWTMLGVGLATEITGFALLAFPHSSLGPLLITGGAGLAVSSAIVAPGDFDELARRYRNARASGIAPEVARDEVEAYWLRAARSEHRSRLYMGLVTAVSGVLGAALWVPTVASSDYTSSKEKPAFAAALGVLVVADTAMLATGITLLVTDGPIESALHDYEASTGYEVKPSAVREVGPRLSLTQGGAIFGVGGRF